VLLLPPHPARIVATSTRAGINRYFISFLPEARLFDVIGSDSIVGVAAQSFHV